MLNKQEFLNRKNRRSLTPKEQANRWRQYQASERGRMTSNGRARNIVATPGSSELTALRINFSPCAQHYLKALTNPFALHHPACVPDLHAVPSKKIRVLTRGNFSTGTQGWGYIVANPWGNSNDTSIIGHTLATYSGAQIIQSPATVPAGTAAQLATKMPYAGSSFQINGSDPGVQARTVGFGLRIRYIGPVLAEGGQVISLRHPDNETLVGKTTEQVKNYATTSTFRVNRKWVYVYYRPTRPGEYEYSRDFNMAVGISEVAWSLGAVITGTTTATGVAGPAPFEFEFIQHVEFLGQIDNITRSHSDVNAMSSIRNALPQQSSWQHKSKHFIETAKSIGKDVIQNAPAALGGAIAAKALMGTEEALPAHVAETAGFLEDSSLFGGLADATMDFLPEVASGAEMLAPLLAFI